MLIAILIIIAAFFIVVERLVPGSELPAVPGWWRRIALINAVQAGIVVLAGVAWDRWFQEARLLHLSENFPAPIAALIAYVISTLVYYWWHRFRHESALFWRLCHQLHHSASRIELLTSFYKHPLEILINSLISAALIYGLLGCDALTGAIYTGLTAVAEYFYHWNIRTPRWIGNFIQRPESHRVHHQRSRHSGNYADLPVWDMLFGTFDNPRQNPAHCGFEEPREQMFSEMLAFKNVHKMPLPPTCMGCGKRTACMIQKMNTDS
jgi:sterol desaturase/sphingolipid hydroxylase (fatty acid hydroxylase superfamily)